MKRYKKVVLATVLLTSLAGGSVYADSSPLATAPKVWYGNMAPDPKSRPAVEAFYNSIKVVDGKITGKMPQVPAGYEVYALYSDYAANKATDFSNYKPGQSFSLPASTEGVLYYELMVKGEGKNTVSIKIPSMDVKWGSKPPEKTPVPSAKPVATAKSSIFKDITDKHWAFQSIKWAVGNKIVSGYSDGTFKPNKEVTEAEFLTMLLNTYKVQLPSGHTWPEAQYIKAKELNYPVLGEEQKNSAIIREKVAELVTAVNGKDYSGKQAIQYLLMNGLANGKTAKSINGFAGNDTLTRAEAVQFLYVAYSKGVTTAQKPQPSPALPTVSDTQIIGKTAPTPAPQPKVGYANMAPDPKSRPAVEAFYNSIKVVDGKITGKMPQVPAGYDVYAKYSDYGNNKLTDLSKLKPGQTFSLPMSTDAALLYLLEINGEGKNFVTIDIPTMDVTWSFKK